MDKPVHQLRHEYKLLTTKKDALTKQHRGPDLEDVMLYSTEIDRAVNVLRGGK